MTAGIVDIIVPSYCPLPLLRAAVRSVRQQDDPYWRLTVVDDAYPGESTEVWFHSLTDERIRYRRNPVTLGLPGNYRKCLEFVDHELVVLMGADDLLLTNYVRTIRRLGAGHPQAGVIQPGVTVIDSDGKPYRALADRAKHLCAPRGPRLLGGEHLAVSLLRGNWLYFPSLAFRSEALLKIGFRHDVDSVHDLALVVDLVMDGQKVLVDPTVCFQYRRHRASDSSERALNGSRFADERQYFFAVAPLLETCGWHHAASAARTHWSSRLHALKQLPQAMGNRRLNAVRTLLRHAFDTSRHPRAGVRRDRHAVPHP